MWDLAAAVPTVPSPPAGMTSPGKPAVPSAGAVGFAALLSQRLGTDQSPATEAAPVGPLAEGRWDASMDVPADAAQEIPGDPSAEASRDVPRGAAAETQATMARVTRQDMHAATPMADPRQAERPSNLMLANLPLANLPQGRDDPLGDGVDADPQPTDADPGHDIRDLARDSPPANAADPTVAAVPVPVMPVQTSGPMSDGQPAPVTPSVLPAASASVTPMSRPEPPRPHGVSGPRDPDALGDPALLSATRPVHGHDGGAVPQDDVAAVIPPMGMDGVSPSAEPPAARVVPAIMQPHAATGDAPSRPTFAPPSDTPPDPVRTDATPPERAAAAPADPRPPEPAEATVGTGDLPPGATPAHVTRPDPAADQRSASPPPAVQIADRLVPTLSRVEATGLGTRHLTLHLDPVELGQVQIRIERMPDMPARVQILVERPETLAMLRQDQAMLEQALDRAGVRGADREIALDLAPPGTLAAQVVAPDRGPTPRAEDPSRGGDSAFAQADPNGDQTRDDRPSRDERRDGAFVTGPAREELAPALEDLAPAQDGQVPVRNGQVPPDGQLRASQGFHPGPGHWQRGHAQGQARPPWLNITA